MSEGTGLAFRGETRRRSGLVQVPPRRLGRTLSLVLCGAGLLILGTAATQLFATGAALRRGHSAEVSPEATRLLQALDEAERQRAWSLVQQRAQEILGLGDTSLGAAGGGEAQRRARKAKERADQEQQNQIVYDRFLQATSLRAYDASVLAYGELPEDSVYRELGAVRYQEMRQGFVRLHLNQARQAARRSCREAQPHLDASLAVWPETAQEPDVKALLARCAKAPVPESPAEPVGAEPAPGRLAQAPQEAAAASPVAARREDLDGAQQAYIAGDYEQAIQLARAFVERSDLARLPPDTAARAWRVIGGSACYLGDEALVRETLHHLNDSSQQFVQHVCRRSGFSP